MTASPSAETRRIADAIRQQLAEAEARGVALVGRTHLGRMAGAVSETTTAKEMNNGTA
jgi:hypothetical protein